MEHHTKAADIDCMNKDDFIGRLTGHRCPKCGCCLWVNLVGNIWCSNCSLRLNDNKIQNFNFVPIPQSHYWRDKGVTILEDPQTTNFKELRQS